MRVAAPLFVAAHGVGYSLWFLGAWLPGALGAGERTLAGFDAPATGVVGKAVGLLAVVVLAGFLASAFGIWQQVAWWPTVLLATIGLAVPVALVWNPAGNASAMAVMANVGLLAATLMPWGERFMGGH